MASDNDGRKPTGGGAALRVLFLTVGGVWCALLAAFLGFILVDVTGWLSLRPLGNVPDPPPAAFPQELAWGTVVAFAAVGAWIGSRLARRVLRHMEDVGR